MIYTGFLSIDGQFPAKIFYKAYTLNDDKRLCAKKPTLIWLHGGPGFDHRAHEPFISSLSHKGVQVVLLDQRGHGQSDDREDSRGWYLDVWADDVFLAIKALGLEEKKVVVGGISFGGVVTQKVAIRHGGCLGGVIFCDTEPRMSREKMLQRFYEKAKAVDVKTAEHVRAVAEKVFRDPTDEEALREHFSVGVPLCGKNPYDTDRLFDCDMNMLVAKHYFENELFQYDHREALGHVSCRILVLHGDQNAVHSKEGAEELIQALPKKLTTVEYMKGAATPAYDFDPERARAIMVDFITLSCE